MPPEIMAKKYFLLELMQFFIEKRQSVLMDSDFNFSILEFKRYAIQKKLSKEQLSYITLEKMREHLDCCAKTPRRDKNLFVINPEAPLLTYTAHARGRDGFTVKNCRTEYLETTRRYIRKTLGIGNDAERNDIENDTKAQFYITKDNEGCYSFEGSPVYIKSVGAQYVIIFDAAYSLKPRGGTIKYQDIVEVCAKRKLKIKKSAILRALTGKDANFFRYVPDIPQVLSYGKALFVALQNGKGIDFNNKK